MVVAMLTALMGSTAAPGRRPATRRWRVWVAVDGTDQAGGERDHVYGLPYLCEGAPSRAMDWKTGDGHGRSGDGRTHVGEDGALPAEGAADDWRAPKAFSVPRRRDDS